MHNNNRTTYPTTRTLNSCSFAALESACCGGILASIHTNAHLLVSLHNNTKLSHPKQRQTRTRAKRLHAETTPRNNTITQYYRHHAPLAHDPQGARRGLTPYTPSLTIIARETQIADVALSASFSRQMLVAVFLALAAAAHALQIYPFLGKHSAVWLESYQ